MGISNMAELILSLNCYHVASLRLMTKKSFVTRHPLSLSCFTSNDNEDKIFACHLFGDVVEVKHNYGLLKAYCGIL